MIDLDDIKWLIANPAVMAEFHERNRHRYLELVEQGLNSHEEPAARLRAMDIAAELRTQSKFFESIHRRELSGVEVPQTFKSTIPV